MPSGPRRDRHGPVDDHGSPTRSVAPGTTRVARPGPLPRASRGTRAVVAALLVTASLAGCAGAAADDAALAPGPAPHAVTPTPTPTPAPAPLLTAEPDEHSEVGEVVDGFPADLLPLPADAMILVTSAVPVGEATDVQEVSLNLTTAASVDEILTLYRDALVAAGFAEVPAPGGALALEATFTRSGGDELVSIGVLDADGRRTVTVGGRVRTAG